MPGMNLALNLNSGKKANLTVPKSVVDRLAFDKSYIFENLHSADGISLTFSGYNEYPRYSFENGQSKIFIDGTPYGKSYERFSEEVTAAVQEVVDSNGLKSERLKELVLSTDGEFTVYYFDHARGVVVVFNDALGRLPYYFQASHNTLLLSRSLKFITGLMPRVEIDKDGLMEYFLFSAPLGSRTFFRGISRLQPANLFLANLKTGEIRHRTLYSYNLDERHEKDSLDHYAESMHDLFMAGIRNRVARFPERKSILAMSGGLDSRTVLMGLLKCDVKVQGITFRDHYNALRRDWPVVEKLVKEFKIQHKFYDVPPDNLEMLEKLIIGKDGMGVMGLMGSVLYWMETIDNDFGKSIVYYTGDEGNYIAAPRFGEKTIKSTPQLVHEIINHNSLSVFSIKSVAAMFDRSPKSVMDYLCAYFDSYIEKNPIHRIDRFFIFERSFKFTMENQDRIRLYFWPMAPHYSIDYARFAFKIPNKYLAGWKVYAGMLKLLNPKSLRLKYANFGIPLDSPLMPIYLPLRALATSNETIRRSLISVLRLMRNPAEVTRKIDELKAVKQLRDYYGKIIDTNAALGGLIDLQRVSEIVENETYIYRLYLITNALKYISTVENRVMPEELKLAV